MLLRMSLIAVAGEGDSEVLQKRPAGQALRTRRSMPRGPEKP